MSFKNYKQTKKSNEKNRQSQLKRYKERPVTKKTKEKHSQTALKQFKNGMPERTKEKIRKTLKRKYKDPRYKKRIAEKIKTAMQRPEVKRRMSEAGKKRTDGFKKHNNKFFGSKNGRWNNGSSLRGYSIEWTDNLRKQIRKRNKFVCQICYKHGHIIHHIDYDKKNNDPKNLVTLCRKCHGKTNSNRKHWIQYFKQNRSKT